MKVVKELPFSLYHTVRLAAIPVKRLFKASENTVPITVSLTSIAHRLPTLHIVIRSLMTQERPPEKIVLWLHHDLQDAIPKSLTKLEGDVFHIRFSSLDAPHLKLVESYAHYPEAILVTCDDDLIYHKSWLATLYAEHQKNPDKIIAIRTSHINHDAAGNPTPFKDWRKAQGGRIQPKALLPIGSWGTLYPPRSLSETTLDEARFMALCPKADDLWFKAMSLLQGTLAYDSDTKPPDPLPIVGTQKVALKKDNIDKDRNTPQWEALNKAFSLNRLILDEK